MTTISYGFRHDPMQYVRQDKSLPACLVRKLVFGTPNNGDAEVLQARIDEIIKSVNPNRVTSAGGARLLAYARHAELPF